MKGVLPSGQIGLAFNAPGHDWDAYNLGEAMGLRGLASLIPLALIWIAAGAALVRLSAPPPPRRAVVTRDVSVAE